MSESEIVYREPWQCISHDYVTNPIPLIKYKDGKTCVFWDVDDYPIPDGRDPLWMKDEIEKALKNQSYFGEISILAYVDKNTFSIELQRKYSDADIKLCPLSGSQSAKAASIYVDVLFWAHDNIIQTNMIVLSKKTDNKETVGLARALFDYGYCILLSSCRSGWRGPSDTEARFLISLFDGGTPSGSKKQKRGDTLSDSEL